MFLVILAPKEVGYIDARPYTVDRLFRTGKYHGMLASDMQKIRAVVDNK